jgi:hypothetical protein
MSNIDGLSALSDAFHGDLSMARHSGWLLALAPLLFGPSAAQAHDWYPAFCCSDRDCHALVEEDGETVTESVGGWRLWDGRTIARGMARLSPDQRFHLCESPAKRIICFFAPPGGS